MSSSPTEAKLAGKLEFIYSPKACSNGMCYNLKDDVKVVTQNNTAVLKGIEIVRITDVKEAIRYIGGVKNLFPLLSEFSISEKRKKVADSESDEEVSTLR